MTGSTKIEWTECTWNPIVGCSVVSPGCTNCYAMRTAARLANNPATPQYRGTVQPSRAGPVWTGKVALAETALMAPLKRREPTTYFVNSMGDLFHDNVPDEWIDRVFAVMALRPQHTFQVLTKRAERMREYVTRLYSKDGFLGNAVTNLRLTVFPYMMTAEDVREKSPFPNVWLGVSAEDQTRANDRIPHLLKTPAAVRFVSCEPLLGPVNLDCLTGRATIGDFADQELHQGHWLDPGVDWVIVGGESGPKARPMHLDWARSLRDQCAAAAVPFFFKQWGECDGAGHRVGKIAAGRHLDGREWNEVPLPFND